MRYVEFAGRKGKILKEAVGMFTVEWENGSHGWLIKTSDVMIIEDPVFSAGDRIRHKETGHIGTVIRTAYGNPQLVTLRWDYQPKIINELWNDALELAIDPPTVAAVSVRGRPRQHPDNAAKQKAYRDRQKALRNSEVSHAHE